MKKKKVILAICAIIVVFVITNCNNANNGSTPKENTVITDSLPPKVAEKQAKDYPIDTLTNAFARFIAGLDEPKYATLQEKPFYKTHKTQIETAWTKILTQNVDKIRQWTIDKSITNQTDTITLLYPFSGPDFLYANAFFPHCQNYILFGLENPGSVPDLTNANEQTLAAYFENLRYSLQYITKMGFFLTNQMKEDFKNKLLDGSLHIILFYIAKYGYDIIDFQTFLLDEKGTIVWQPEILTDSKKVQGTKITFRANDKIKALYYFQLDVSDENLNDKPEFATFIANFKNKIAYMKSASYLLHRPNFSTIRNIVLNQTIKVLQDDTGVPFSYFNNDNFDVQLFGIYTRTITLFKTRFQSDLKEEIDSIKPEKLPFTIGYNAQFEEAVLIFAKSKKNINAVKDTTISKTESEKKK